MLVDDLTEILNELGGRIKKAFPILSCKAGKNGPTERIESLYLSMLLNPNDDGIDLLLYFKRNDEEIAVSGDLLTGSGTTIWEMEPIEVPKRALRQSYDRQVDSIRNLILRLEPAIVRQLRQQEEHRQAR